MNAQLATAFPSPEMLISRIHPKQGRAGIRLFIADDHTLFRQTLRMVLEIDGGFSIVGEASDGREALSAIEKSEPDLALIDLGLPLLNGLEVARRLRKMGTRTRVIVLGSRAQEAVLLRMMDPAVAGYLLKEADFQELTLALRKVHSGFFYFTPSLEECTPDRYLRRLQTHEVAPVDRLTSRERELLQLVGEGYANREIADQLCLSVKTVEAHKANICSKLNVRGHAGLVRYAIHAGMAGIDG